MLAMQEHGHQVRARDARLPLALVRTVFAVVERWPDERWAADGDCERVAASAQMTTEAITCEDAEPRRPMQNLAPQALTHSMAGRSICLRGGHVTVARTWQRG